MALKEPYFFNSIEPSIYQTGAKDWLIDNINVGKSFQNYQIKVAEEFQSKEIRVETDTHEILALSNILLIKHGQNSKIFSQFFSNSTITMIEEKVQEKFGIISFDSSNIKDTTHFDIAKDTKNNLEDVIKSVIRREISTKQASKKITNLTSDESECTPDDMLLLGVRNLADSISLVKNKELVRESNLSCAYVNSVLNPIFTSPDDNRLLVW